MMYLLPATPSPRAFRSKETWIFRFPSSTKVFGQTRAISSSLLTTSPQRSTNVIRIQARDGQDERALQLPARDAASRRGGMDQTLLHGQRTHAQASLSWSQ